MGSNTLTFFHLQRSNTRSTMYRHQLKALEHWLQKPNRKPLILRGARQVGKSTLVRLFAEQKALSLAEINLERYPELATTFAGKNPGTILNVLETLPRMPSIEANGLLFLDEIQAVPEAIPALRYFYEDRADLAVLAAGSLLEFALSDHRFSMPVGRVEYLHMGPMTFSEFLKALGENKLLAFINQFELGHEIAPLIHLRLLELLRTYCFVGGMPEAVSVFAQSRRQKDVGDVHHSILDTYREDFPKYIGSRNLGRIQHVFNFAARNIGKKVKYSHFSETDKSATIKSDIELLCMARVISKVVHSHCSGLPLQADVDDKAYKLLFLDVGLMNAVCGLGWNYFPQLSDTKLVNEGSIAEQFIGQHLQHLLAPSHNRELVYWLREGRANNAEVDYVIAIDGNIVAVEVKSGATGSLKSLHQFVAEKRPAVAVRFDAGLPSQQSIKTKVKQENEIQDLAYELISLPLYLVERLEHVVCTHLAKPTKNETR